MKLFSGSRGMGFMEVLLAAGLMGGLSLVITQLVASSQRSINNLESSSEILTTVQGIQSLLSKPENCTASFKGKKASNHQDVTSFLIKKIPSGFAYEYKTAQADPSMTYGHRGLKIKSYSLSDAGGEVDVTNLQTTHLLVEFDRGKNSLRKVVTKKIPLKVEVDGSGNILTCVALSHASDNIWSHASNNEDIYYAGGRVGIGTATPIETLSISGGGAKEVTLSLKNTGTGIGGRLSSILLQGVTTASGGEYCYCSNPDAGTYDDCEEWEGTIICGPGTVQSTTSWRIAHNTDDSLGISKSGGTVGQVITMKGDGKVGIGVTDPKVKLDIFGDIKLWSTGLKPCDASLEGTLRYNKSSKVMEYCGGDPLVWQSMSPGAGIGCPLSGRLQTRILARVGDLATRDYCLRVTCTNGVLTEIRVLPIMSVGSSKCPWILEKGVGHEF